MFTPNQITVNSNLSQSAVVGALTNASDFDTVRASQIQTHKSLHEFVSQLCSRLKYNQTAFGILFALITLAENRGELFHSQQRIADVANLGIATIQKWLKIFVEDGLITKQRRGAGWQDRQTNRTILLFMEHWKPDVPLRAINDKNLNKDLYELRDQDQGDDDSVKAKVITQISKDCNTKRQIVVKWANVHGLTALYNTYKACKAYEPTNLGAYVRTALASNHKPVASADWQVRQALAETPKGEWSLEKHMAERWGGH